MTPEEAYAKAIDRVLSILQGLKSYGPAADEPFTASMAMSQAMIAIGGLREMPLEPPVMRGAETSPTIGDSTPAPLPDDPNRENA